MIATSRIVKCVAVSAAALAHAAIALALMDADQPLTEGAIGAAEVRLGNSFSDMVAGKLITEKADTTVEAETTMQAIEVENAKGGQTLPEVVKPTASAAPQVREHTANSSVDTAMIVPETAVESTLPLQSEPAEPLELRPRQTVTASKVSRDSPARISSPAETLQGTTPDTTTVSRSVRPRQRSAAFEAQHEKAAPTPEPKRAAKPKPRNKAKKAPKRQPERAAPGNARQNARAGKTTGRQNAEARSSGSAGRQQSAGNAAVSNYPGLVMRKISRAGRPRVRARGAAVVAFSISSGGGLASISIARSSGSSALDRAAVRVVRNAAPFPKPPSGARRNFSIQIQGR